MAPIQSQTSQRRRGEYQNSLEDWEDFKEDMKRFYHVSACGCEPLAQRTSESGGGRVRV